MEISNELLSLFMFVGVFVGILGGFPVAFSLLGMAFLFGIPAFGDALPAFLIRRIFTVASNYVLAAVPFFVFMGVMLEKSGMAERLFGAIKIWMGKVKGGLAISTIILCTIIAASTGIIGASEVIVGLLALPIMLKSKYQKELATGTIIAGGALGTLIPPSVVTVIYGPTAGVSVGRLLISTILPGLMLSTLFILYIVIRCQLNPSLGPVSEDEDRNLSFVKKFRLTAFSLIPPLLLIFTVLGSIILGLAAPTEAAAMGAAGSMLLAIAYRKLTWQVLKDALYQTIKLTTMIMLVLVAGNAYSGVFLGLGGGLAMEQIILNLNMGQTGILLSFLFIIFLGGFLLDWTSILLIFIPIFAPIVVKAGIDPVLFGTLVIMMIQTSYLTPPMAPGIFYLKGIAPPAVKDTHIFKGIIPFALIQLFAIGLVILFPQIALWLPEVILSQR